MQKSLSLYLLMMVLLCASCASDPYAVDVSDVEVDWNLQRLDAALIESPEGDYSATNIALSDSFGRFYEIYLSSILRIGGVHERAVPDLLQQFVQNAVVEDTWPAIQAQFGDGEALKASFDGIFKRFRYHFPNEYYIPDVVTMHTGFNYGVFPTDSIIGLGLEMYLGPNSEIVQSLPNDDFPDYLKEQMRKEYLITDALTVWLSNTFYDEEAYGSTFASQMIFHGKVAFLSKALMPDVGESTVLKYTAAQMSFCDESAGNIWYTLIEKNLLYSTNEMEMQNWMGDAPFTKGLPREAPPRVGKWLGWRIVSEYMKTYPDVSLKELMETGSQKILNTYKPEK